MPGPSFLGGSRISPIRPALLNWAPPLTGEAQLPGENDQQNYSDATGVPVENMTNSDFIAEGRWGGVDEALRGVYKEASEKLGRKFEYPTK